MWQITIKLKCYIYLAKFSKKSVDMEVTEKLKIVIEKIQTEYGKYDMQSILLLYTYTTCSCVNHFFFWMNTSCLSFSWYPLNNFGFSSLPSCLIEHCIVVYVDTVSLVLQLVHYGYILWI